MKNLIKKVQGEKKIDKDKNIKKSIYINSLKRNFGELEFDNNVSSLEIIKKYLKKNM